MNSLIKDGYERLVLSDCVLWYLETPRLTHIYCVARFPFVPHYHICELTNYPGELPTEYPLQTFKTLAEAFAVMRVLDASTKENQ